MLAKTNNQPVDYSTHKKTKTNSLLSQGYRVLFPEIPVGLRGGQLLPPAVPRAPKKKQPFPSAPRGWLPIPQVLSFRAPSPHLTLHSLQVESRFLKFSLPNFHGKMYITNHNEDTPSNYIISVCRASFKQQTCHQTRNRILLEAVH